MKKKIGMVVFVLIIINVLAVILLMMHKETTKVEKPDTASKQEMVKNEGKAYASHYQLQVSLDTQNKVLSGTVCAILKNATDEDLEKICVRNWAAAILKGKKFKTEIPKQKNRFGYVLFDGHEMYQLSFCFPSISLYQNGQWNENPYMGDNDETYVNEAADYDVTFLHPKNYTVAAAGTEHSMQDGTRITGKNLREFAAVVSDDFCRLDANEWKTTISILAPDYKKNQKYYKYSLQLAKEAVRVFSEKIGEYPFTELKIVHCFFDGAMEYPGLCMIGMPDVKEFRNIDKNSFGKLESHVPHEIAHQWFYAAIGNDSYKEPWLDEGFSEFCEDILFPYFANKKLQKTLWGNKYNSRKDMDKWFRKIVIPQSMRTKPINRKVSDYQETSDEYSTCVYEGGKLFLYELWKAMGDKTFFEMLQKYYQTYQFRLATTEDFLIMVRAVGKDEKVEQIIERYVE